MYIYNAYSSQKQLIIIITHNCISIGEKQKNLQVLQYISLILMERSERIILYHIIRSKGIIC